MKKTYLLVLFIISTNFAGENGAAFLKITPSPRNTALGSAATASSGELESLYYNPAGLTNLKRTYYLNLTNRMGFLETSYNVLTAAYHDRSLGTFALGLIGMNVEGIDRRTAGNVYEGEMSTDHNAYFLTYARNIIGSYSIGVSLKYVNIGFDLLRQQVNGSGFGLDLGLIYDLNNNIKLGIYLQDNFNISWAESVSDEVPLNVNIGTLYKMTMFPNTPKIFFNINQQQNYPMSLDLGTEYPFHFGEIIDEFALRIGFSNFYVESRELRASASDLNDNNFSFATGFGIKSNLNVINVNFDYTFKTHSYLNNVHYTGISIIY